MFNLRWFISPKFLRCLAPFWVLGLIVGSFLPADAKEFMGTHPGVRRGPHHFRATSVRHRVFHFIAFGATAILFLRISNEKREELLWMIAIVALGTGIEIGQHRVFGIEFEWWDVRDDAYAVAAVFLAFKLFSLSPQYRNKTLISIKSNTLR